MYLRVAIDGLADQRPEAMSFGTASTALDLTRQQKMAKCERDGLDLMLFGRQ